MYAKQLKELTAALQKDDGEGFKQAEKTYSAFWLTGETFSAQQFADENGMRALEYAGFCFELPNLDWLDECGPSEFDSREEYNNFIAEHTAKFNTLRVINPETILCGVCNYKGEEMSPKICNQVKGVPVFTGKSESFTRF